ncbi:hypothetical protein [Adlercreutzia caecimuris]|uniref:Uncharacterized protein n=1 Tax=Adlercreutzia caecimuris TaxID=671266 RepID=A0A4S4G2D4_9ACTN|nr:hypothetical protein [Adlercreutzia caecimuris]THG36861.1 hypothetical protein E5986_08140 [Adlercreutzia caecimuris]
MTEKDPEDMTASELLRWAANGEPNEYGNTTVIHKLLAALSGKRYSSTTNDDDARNISALADKIDAEIEAARRDAAKEPRKPMFAIRRIIASGTDWPEPRDGSVRVSLSEGKGWTNYLADRLTHNTPPDTQERIDADVMKEYIEYWGCVGMSCEGCPAKIDGEKPWRRYDVGGCHEAMVLDLLRRQRQLDARKGGVE